MTPWWRTPWWRRNAQKLKTSIAWSMPRWLVYWCFVRVVSEGTTHEYSDTIPTDITAYDALVRWEMHPFDRSPRRELPS